jgi:saccharopine dehydrogenase (NAD+, L-lysine-forming)
MDFGREFKKQFCASMFLEEMRSLPEQFPSLKETGFFVGSFNWFVDWLILPLGMVAFKISPKRAARPVAKLTNWGLRKFSSPPYGMILKLEAEGKIGGNQKTYQLSLSHADGYLFTAIPVVACLLQVLDGSVRRPGLWTQANLVEPDRFMRDMQRMGVEIREEERGYNG